MPRWYHVRIKKDIDSGAVLTILIVEGLETVKEEVLQIDIMRRIQTWNGMTWIDTRIEDLPLGKNVIKIIEEPAQVLTFRGIPIHTCKKAPSPMTMVDQRLIASGICPFCQETIVISKEEK